MAYGQLNMPSPVEMQARGQQQGYARRLSEIDLQNKREAQMEAQRQDIGRAAQWVMAQPENMREQAFNQALDFYEGQGEDVSAFRGRMDVLPMLAQMGQGGAGMERYGRMQAAMKGDQPVFIQTSQAGGVREVEGYTPLTTEYKTEEARAIAAAKEKERTKALMEQEEKLKGKQLQFQKDEIDLAKKKMEYNALQTAQTLKEGETSQTMGIMDELLGADLDSIYGKEEKYWPDLLRSQSSIDLMTKRDQLVALFKLASRGKLKGQGSVSDSESKTLEESATILGNIGISPEAAREEIARAREALRLTLESSTPAAGKSVDEMTEAELDAIIQGGR